MVTYQPDLARLRRLLDAVAPQVAHVVVVDNGSGDDCLGWLRSLASQALTLVELGSNRGIAAAQNIGMALHELATNASKYGALSVPSGRIRISWEDYRDESGTARIRIHWEEHGGPPVSPPSRSGFGRAITEMIVPKSLGGRAQFDWKPEGLVWTLDIPADGAVSVAAGGSRSS